jgi:hydroxymethylbilane synthase
VCLQRKHVTMRMPPDHIRIGTRGSALARLQTEIVAQALRVAWPGVVTTSVVITTTGDAVQDRPLTAIGGKGLFTAELEAALRDGSIDLAVHSLKDLPSEESPGLVLGAILPRDDERDALVSRGRHTLAGLPVGAVVGTGSLRRGAQVRALRPDLRIEDLRGNADTRLRKALDADGAYDAVVVAAAALARLGRSADASEFFDPDELLPAPGQGALAVQCRDEDQSRRLLAPLHDGGTAAATAAERAFLEGLGGGCAVPIAAHGSLDAGGLLRLRGRVCSVDGERRIDVEQTAPVANGTPAGEAQARDLGLRLARKALELGAGEILNGRARGRPCWPTGAQHAGRPPGGRARRALESARSAAARLSVHPHPASPRLHGTGRSPSPGSGRRLRLAAADQRQRCSYDRRASRYT